jgi:SRSO17 transposase
VVDGVSFPKQGEKSVGVARQWCGNLGKVENCQVGVFLGLATPEGERTLIDERLYLPEEWIEDEERREEAGVPEDVEFKTKPELALEMIKEAKKNDVEFGWVNADSLYGRSSSFRENLDEEDVTYMVDIPKDTKVWLAEEIDPQSEIDKPPKRADELEKTLDSNQKKEVEIRETERGKLESEVTALRVHTNKNDHPSDREEWLLIRRDQNKDKTKYFLSNAPPETSLHKLVKMSSTRYWIERAIEDGKGEIGMDDYEVRKWKGWHHHMTMTMLAMLLLLEMKIDLEDKCPDLTVQDVRDILQRTLPKKEVTKNEFRRLINKKIKRRKSAKKSRHRKNKNS